MCVATPIKPRSRWRPQSQEEGAALAVQLAEEDRRAAGLEGQLAAAAADAERASVARAAAEDAAAAARADAAAAAGRAAALQVVRWSYVGGVGRALL